VAPPTPPNGTKGEFLTVSKLPAAAAGIRGPVGLGFRVPMPVVSPYSRGGLLGSDTFDHTSILRFLETRFGVELPNLSGWRRKVTGDLTSAFNFAAAPRTKAPALAAPAGAAGQCIGGTPVTGRPTLPAAGARQAPAAQRDRHVAKLPRDIDCGFPAAALQPATDAALPRHTPSNVTRRSEQSSSALGPGSESATMATTSGGEDDLPERLARGQQLEARASLA
jgi:phospholipase C